MRPRIIEIRNDLLVMRSPARAHSPINEITLNRPSAYPVVKWAGGKQWLAVAARHLAPSKWSGRYYEPFLGGGAFFFALAPDWASLSDRNEELITTYCAIRDNPEEVIKLLSRYPHEEEFYYCLRSKHPRTSITVAARLLYLNRTCWNGLYRVNAQGKFNTPFGNITNPTICDKERIRAASKSFKNARLRAIDFGGALSEVKQNDFLYLDPPYITGHKNNGFIRYNSRLFSWTDQKRLAQWAIRLAEAGVHILISNADHPSVVSLYRGFFYYQAPRGSEIAGKLSARGVVTEALLSSYPLTDCESEII